MNRKIFSWGLAFGVIVGMLLLLLQGKIILNSDDVLLRVAEDQQLLLLQKFCGAVLMRDEQLEPVIAEALKEDNAIWQEQGAVALNKYGYHLGEPLEGSYLGLFEVKKRQLTGFFGLTLVILAAMFLWQMAYKRQQQKDVIAVLENYLSGDYTFASALNGKGQQSCFSRQIEDLLKALGNQMQLKYSRLAKEKENTQSLVTDISHQLKTPIAGLKISFALMEEADSPEEKIEFTQRAQMQIDKLEALSTNLINISRLETAMIALKPELVDLHNILLGAVNGVYDKAKNKAIQLEIADFAPINLEVDYKWTVEAIMNVLDNGIKYSPDHTLIKIAVKPLVNFVRIEISDQGIGIARDERHKVFTRFYRGDNPVVKQNEGVGVGLYLSRMILQQQGGSITVKGNHYGGSTFVIQLKLNHVLD